MTATIEIVTEDDLPPERELDDAAPGRCQYDGCSNSVTKPSRGRSPKYCDEHRTAAKTPSGKRQAGWPKASSVESALVRYLNGLSFVVSMVNTADGTVIANGSDAVAHELVELGRQDKKLRDLLEKLTAPGKYGPLMLAVLPIAVGLMVNHNLLPQFILGPPTTSEGGTPNE